MLGTTIVDYVTFQNRHMSFGNRWSNSPGQEPKNNLQNCFIVLNKLSLVPLRCEQVLHSLRRHDLVTQKNTICSTTKPDT